MITLRAVGSSGTAAPRRALYRQGKRLLSRLLTHTWAGRRGAVEPAIRRFLRGRPCSYLVRLVGDRSFALAAAASLLAACTAHALPPVDLADVAAGDGGFVINGVDPPDQSGFNVSGAGDVNGDGLEDVIVGTLFGGSATFAGESYVVFGKADGTPVELADVVAGTGGFVIKGIDPADYSGVSVSGAGDVNGDGLADVIVAAPGADPGGNSTAGETYVVFGKADGTAVELADVAAGTGGFVINGIDPYDLSGISVSGAGDVNGDGLADVIVGAPGADVHENLAGESYVVFGKADGAAVELADVVAGTGGFVINGIDFFDSSGSGVSDAGDVNGDGLADVIVAAPGYCAYCCGEKKSYVIFGKADGMAVELAAVAAGIGGFVIDGHDSPSLGPSVSGAGDVNGDGLDDVIVGLRGAACNPHLFGPSESYVVFGKADGTAVGLPEVAAGMGGFVITNETDPYSSYSAVVSGAGDVNGDGLDDVIVGAPGGNLGAGQSFVVFSPVIPGDLDGDGAVSVVDLLLLLAAWGLCQGPCPPLCPGDLDGDCQVGIVDFLTLLANWS